MNVIRTEIDGVLILEPRVFGDSRGCFFESYNQRDFDDAVGSVRFVQDNESRSVYGVLRGIHFQRPPHAQAKLVRVTAGRVLDVAVDLRRSSPTFGRWTGVELSEDNHRQVYLPKGIGHAFVVLSPQAVFQYKCDELYCPQSEGGIAWNDPDLAIDWHLPAGDIILSDKDRGHPLLRDAGVIFD